MSIKWNRVVIFDGIQIVWTAEGKDITITQDNRRAYRNRRYPYSLSVRGSYRSHYRRLNDAKEDGIKIEAEYHD